MLWTINQKNRKKKGREGMVERFFGFNSKSASIYRASFEKN
jgi:hypothetical protein